MDIYNIFTHNHLTLDKANPAERQEQKVADPIHGEPDYRRWLQKVTQGCPAFSFFAKGKI